MRTSAGAALAAAALVLAGNGGAAWVASSTGSGAVGSKTMPAGNVPSASAALNDVTASWSASSFAGGDAVSGYVVRRYDWLTGVAQTVLAGCSGIVSGTSCAENGVPAGTWAYSVTPAQGDWRGAESGQSAPVIVL